MKDKSETKYIRIGMMSQGDGTVFLDGEHEDITLVVDKDNTLALLSTVLNAIRIEDDTDKKRACRMLCKAMLGPES